MKSLHLNRDGNVGKRNVALSYSLGEHSYFKPPFEYWVTLVSWNIFGFGNLTLFSSILALLGTSYWIDKIQDDKDDLGRALLCGIFFGTLTFGTTHQMEIWIVFFYMTFWGMTLQFLNSKKWLWLYGALAVAGISSLVKSPLYSVFSVLGLWLFLLLSRRVDVFKRWHFYFAHT